MTKAYTIPDTPHASIRPNETGYRAVPISRMVPRSFITNLASGAILRPGKPTLVRGIAFGGDCGVRQVEFSADAGTTWQTARLGADEGTYGFRRWQATFTPGQHGTQTLMVRCTNSRDVVQPDAANWNPGGFMRNVIEATPVMVA
jgi:hypothetical protein